MSWFRRAASDEPYALASARLIVFDLETTGLNPRRDKPLSIGAAAIQAQALAFADSFQQRIQQSQESQAEALLAHRLTSEQFEQAMPPKQALTNFLSYVDGCPCFAYHSAFDDGVLKRSLKQLPEKPRWPASIDVAQWVLWLHPELGPKPPTLDRALAFARIRRDTMQRHDALSDAWLTAQLGLTLIQETLDRGIADTVSLRKSLADHQKLLHMRSSG